MKCFRCKKSEPEAMLHELRVSVRQWYIAEWICSNCVQWLQNIIHDAEKNNQ